MKNLLLPLIFTFLSFGSYLNAQNCAITEAYISANDSCLFVKFLPGLDSAFQVTSEGQVYTLNDTVGEYYRYSIADGNTELSDCDTNGMNGFTGKINATLLGGDFTCEFIDGMALPSCPDGVSVSRNETCLVFYFEDEPVGDLPDTVRLNDTLFFIKGYTSGSADPVLYSSNEGVDCDTTEASGMSPMPLTDTLFIGEQVCTYEVGVLPISILAFDYKNETNGVALSWAVNSEEPAQKLHLQRSYDGVNWVSVYEQNLDNYLTGQTMDGKYMDQSIEQAKVYYRLFISGYAGEAKYSNILPVTMKDQVINNLFYQSQSRSIMIKAGQNYAGEMHLMNTHGQNVMTKKIRIQKNTMQEVNIQGHLTPGIYFVKFENSLIPPAKLFID